MIYDKKIFDLFLRLLIYLNFWAYPPNPLSPSLTCKTRKYLLGVWHDEKWWLQVGSRLLLATKGHFSSKLTYRLLFIFYMSWFMITRKIKGKSREVQWWESEEKGIISMLKIKIWELQNRQTESITWRVTFFYP